MRKIKNSPSNDRLDFLKLIYLFGLTWTIKQGIGKSMIIKVNQTEWVFNSNDDFIYMINVK